MARARWQALGTSDGATAAPALPQRPPERRRALPAGAGHRNPGVTGARRSAARPGARERGPGGARPRSAGTALSMTEEIPAASSMPECNGSVPPEQGPLPLIGATDETAKSVGTAPSVNAGGSPEAAPAEEDQEGNRNSLAAGRARGGCDGEEHCEGEVQGCLSSSVREAGLWFMHSLTNKGMCCVC